MSGEQRGKNEGSNAESNTNINSNIKTFPIKIKILLAYLQKKYIFCIFLQIGKCMCEKVPFSRACTSFYGSLRIIKANPCQKNYTVIVTEVYPHFCRLIPKITAIFEVQLHKLHYLFLLSNFCKIYGLPRFLLIHSL